MPNERGFHRKKLTAAQHRAIRVQLFLIPLYVWSIFIWTTFIQQLPFERFRDTSRVFRDFAHFYVLGLIAARHDASALHDEVAQRLLVSNLGIPDHVDALFVPSYGPQVALLFRPFAVLSYTPALLVWLTLTLLLYVAATLTLWRDAAGLRTFKWPVFVAVVSAPALHAVLMYGQTSVIALCCFVAAYWCLVRGREFSAGLAIGLLFYKPQLGLASAILFVAIGQWRVVVGASCAILAQLVGAAVYWGPASLAAYWRALSQIPLSLSAIEPEKQHLHSWRAFFQLAGIDGPSLTLLTLLACGLTAALGIAIWRFTADLRLRFIALLTMTALINPHMYVYDLVILVPVCLWMAEISSTSSNAGRAAISIALATLMYAASLFEPLAGIFKFQPSVLAMVLLLGWTFCAARDTRCGIHRQPKSAHFSSE